MKDRIEDLWERGSGDVSCVLEAMEKLDKGELRVAEPTDGLPVVNQYLKKAILLYFKHIPSRLMPGDGCNFFDKVPLKTQNWTESDFTKAGFRAVPGSLVRYSAYIAKSAVLMPCFVNVGARVGEGTMIDSHALVGSCAQIGKGCHISDGVTVAGVLEPLQAAPVIIGDNCFIGARSVVSEGVIIGEGSVLGAGTILSASSGILDKSTGEITRGRIPPYSVAVPGTRPSGNVNLCCTVIIKKTDEQTRKKTTVNELLR